MMRIILVNLSTIFETMLLPFLVLGSGSTKSIVITSHFGSASSIGFKSLHGLGFRAFIC